MAVEANDLADVDVLKLAGPALTGFKVAARVERAGSKRVGLSGVAGGESTAIADAAGLNLAGFNKLTLVSGGVALMPIPGARNQVGESRKLAFESCLKNSFSGTAIGCSLSSDVA